MSVKNLNFAAGVRSDYGTIHIVSSFAPESPFNDGVELNDTDIIIADDLDPAVSDVDRFAIADRLRTIADRHGVTNLATQVALLSDIVDGIYSPDTNTLNI